uniref:Uncharacterized protein n=1 Tax=Onchocerca volvulus TaxID=6282 RepID=A0A8R1TMC5_ONCVO
MQAEYINRVVFVRNAATSFVCHMSALLNKLQPLWSCIPYEGQDLTREQKRRSLALLHSMADEIFTISYSKISSDENIIDKNDTCNANQLHHHHKRHKVDLVSYNVMNDPLLKFKIMSNP